MKFRKKPVVIEAIQFNGSNHNQIVQFVDGATKVKWSHGKPGLVIGTLEDGQDQVEHVASPGDWIIKGIRNEFYPCKPDIFEQTYEPVE